MEFRRDPVTKQYIASPLTDAQIDIILANYRMAAKCVNEIMEEAFPETHVTATAADSIKFHQNVKIQHRAFKDRKKVTRPVITKDEKPYVVRKLVFEKSS